jgi:hypothetical protein
MILKSLLGGFKMRFRSLLEQTPKTNQKRLIGKRI